jgi:conjugal transfer pilus assembly protein TraE
MKMKKAEKAFRDISAENVILRMGVGAALCVASVFAFFTVTKDETVILVPPFQHEDITFINGKANTDYYEQWAWSVAMLAGNITPGNASFVRDALQQISTPALYRKLMETVDIELQNIARDNAVIMFSPRSITYDPEIDRYFVVGRQQITGPGIKSAIDKQMTYELSFKMEHLRVYLASYAVYEGKPLTAKIRDTELQKLEEEAAKEAEGN